MFLKINIIIISFLLSVSIFSSAQTWHKVGVGMDHGVVYSLKIIDSLLFITGDFGQAYFAQ
ncbi:MAG: hypothetical protein HY738_21105 [Bacteroidia bacterium]|nr:hypothetical protein [Bacteroidia bacterium]